MARHKVAQRLKMLGNVYVDDCSRNDQFEEMNERRHRQREDVNAYKIEKRKLERRLLKQDVAMIWSVVDVERTENRPKAENYLFMKTIEEAVSCSLQNSTSSGLYTDNVLTHISLM